MTKRVLTQMQAGEIRRMRAELNDWGEPKWTGAEIAHRIGCSESTVWRVLTKQAAYAKMGKVEPGGLSFEAAHAALVLAPETPGLQDGAAASQARFIAMLVEPKEASSEAKPPLSPLDGADVPSETSGSVAASLADRAKAYDLDIEQLRSK